MTQKIRNVRVSFQTELLSLKKISHLISEHPTNYKVSEYLVWYLFLCSFTFLFIFDAHGYIL